MVLFTLSSYQLCLYTLRLLFNLVKDNEFQEGVRDHGQRLRVYSKKMKTFNKGPSVTFPLYLFWRSRSLRPPGLLDRIREGEDEFQSK